MGFYLGYIFGKFNEASRDSWQFEKAKPLIETFADYVIQKGMALERLLIVATSADMRYRKRKQRFQDGTRKAAYAIYIALDAAK